MYKRRIGVGAGLISYATLLASRGGARRPANTPTLILDFVGYTDPNTVLPGSTLDMSFAGSFEDYLTTGSLQLDFIAQTYAVSPAPDPAYSVYTPDPSQPQSGITSYYVWN